MPRYFRDLREVINKEIEALQETRPLASQEITATKAIRSLQNALEAQSGNSMIRVDRLDLACTLYVLLDTLQDAYRRSNFS